MNTLFFTTYESPVGTLYLKSNQDALLSVSFHPDEAMQETGINPILATTIDQLDAYFAGTRTSFELPLDPQGTSFQKSVWEALCKIPYGTVASYQEIAISIGNPKAVRAVGMANNHNPIGIIIPCHRVIGKNGSLVGYAGGLDKKQWLLSHEKKHQDNT